MSADPYSYNGKEPYLVIDNERGYYRAYGKTLTQEEAKKLWGIVVQEAAST